MSKQSLKEFYDTHIRHLSQTDFVYYKIKNMMKNGCKQWKIELMPDQYYNYPAHGWFEITNNTNNIYISDPYLLTIVECIIMENLNYEYSVDGSSKYLIISW